MNEIIDKVQGLRLEDVFVSWEEKLENLSQPEFIGLAVIAAVGVLLCLFGLKIVRVWAVLTGLFLGLAGGVAAAHYLGAEENIILIAGAAAGIILAFLGGFFYRFGIFITVLASAGGIYFEIVQPADYIPAAAGIAAALVIAVLAVKFVNVLTIFATSLWGGMIAGTSVYQFIPVRGKWLSILLCAFFAIAGIMVQLLFESVKRKRRNLKKAAEIRETQSTENEIEKARAFIDDFSGPGEEKNSGSEEYEMEVIEFGEDDTENPEIDEE